MRNRFLVPVSAVIALGALAPQALSQETLKDVKEAAQQAIYDLTDKESVVLSFPARSAKLTTSQVSELRTTINAFKDDAKIEQIVVASYSDKPYPRSVNGALSSADRKLASDRGKAVSKRIETLGGKNVKVYNMAESANWFERFLVTSDAQVKREANEQPADLTSEDAFFEALGKRLGAVGGPGKVVVVLRHAVTGVSH